MRLPDHQQIFFMHLPGTGGPEMPAWILAGLLQRAVGKKRFLQVRPPQVQKLTAHQMQRYRIIRAHWDYSAFTSLPRKPLYITLMRHPVPALLTHYGIVRGLQANARPKRAWRLHLLEKMPVWRANYATYYFAGAYHQSEGRSPEAMLEAAMTRLDEFAFVGLCEQFVPSLKMLFALLGIDPPPADLTAYSEPEIPADLWDRTASVCRYDLQLYEFAADLFHQRLRESDHAAQAES